MTDITDSRPHITVVPRENAEALWVLGDRVRFMGTLSGTPLSVIEVDVPPGSGTPPHHHPSPEIFSVTDGTITFGQFTDASSAFHPAGVGTIVHVPAHAPHNYRNASNEPARMLVVVEQSLIDFFRDVGRVEAPPPGPPSAAALEHVLAACARHHITMVAAHPQ